MSEEKPKIIITLSKRMLQNTTIKSPTGHKIEVKEK